MELPTHVVFTTVAVSRVQVRRAVELLRDLAGSYGAEIEASSDGNKDTINVQSVRSGGRLDTGEQDDGIARALPGVRIVSVMHRLDQSGRYVPVPSTARLDTPVGAPLHGPTRQSSMPTAPIVSIGQLSTRDPERAGVKSAILARLRDRAKLDAEFAEPGHDRWRKHEARHELLLEFIAEVEALADDRP
jgi:hypothetical protein